MAGADERDSWKRRARLVSLLPPAGLAGVLLAIAAGASRTRWLPVGAFLAVAVVADAYFWIGRYAQRRRVSRLRQTEVVFGIRHHAPPWMSMIESTLMLGLGGIAGAIAAAVGFPSVGFGVLLVTSGFAVFALVMKHRMWPRGLTFETGGLRVHVTGGSFVVPWAAITGIDRVGPDQMQIIQIKLAGADLVMEEHESRIDSLIYERSRARGKLTLMPWTAGLDGATIARTINAAMRGTTDRVN